MELFGLTIKRKSNRYGGGGNQATDEDRRVGNEIKRINQEMKTIRLKMEKENLEAEYQLQQLRREAERLDLEERLGLLDDDNDQPVNESESVEDFMLKNMMNKIFNQNNPSSNSAGAEVMQSAPETSPSKITLSDDDIRNIIDSSPKNIIELAKKMSAEQIRSWAKANPQFNNYSDETIEKAIAIIKGL